jgi:Meiotically up-regulated gene 113
MPVRGTIPGLKKHPRKDGTRTWFWVASQVSRETKGFKPRTRLLWRGAGEPAAETLKLIEQECSLLNSNLLAWKVSGNAPRATAIVLGEIYFITDAAGFIKIGFSTDISQRQAALQISSPGELRLIGRMSASKRMEAELQRRFRALRVGGEWYRPEKVLLDFIRFEAPLEAEAA